MGHKNKKTLIRQVSEELDDQFRAGKGRKKHIDKQTPDGMTGRIYTDTTLATYKKHCCYFVRWAKVAHSCATLNECKKYVPEWMETRRGLSAWTQKTEASALAKLYRCRAEDLGISTPARKRTAIKRSRGPKRNDAHFSEKNNIEIVTFGRCTGLRRRELSRIRGSALSEIGGSFYLSVKDGTKGKRERTVRITGTPEEVELVVRLCRECGDRRIFPRVPHNMDEHSYRREYANRIYQFYKRPLWALSRNQKYYCRGDLRGIVYDRRALHRASEALGHSRLCIIPSNYAPDP